MNAESRGVLFMGEEGEAGKEGGRLGDLRRRCNVISTALWDYSSGEMGVLVFRKAPKVANGGPEIRTHQADSHETL